VRRRFFCQLTRNVKEVSLLHVFTRPTGETRKHKKPRAGGSFSLASAARSAGARRRRASGRAVRVGWGPHWRV
jgi:hypothetical protein